MDDIDNDMPPLQCEVSFSQFCELTELEHSKALQFADWLLGLHGWDMPTKLSAWKELHARSTWFVKE